MPQEPHGNYRHTLLLFSSFQIPLLLLWWHFGNSLLFCSAQYNLAGITLWCLLRGYFWKNTANCMACSLFCTLVVWAMPILLSCLVFMAQGANGDLTR